MDSLRNGHSNRGTEFTGISSAPDLYLVEFTFGREPNNRVSIILSATCGLSAMTGAWALFPEYKRDAKHTHVHPLRYVEINWLDGRTIIVKKERPLYIPASEMKDPNKRSRKKKNDVESSD